MVTVSSFKIGMSREMREELRRNLMQRRVQGVYTKATMFGYRDANMINNYTRRYDDQGGHRMEYNEELYYVPTENNVIMPFLNVSTDTLQDESLRYKVGNLSEFGGLSGYTDKTGNRGRVMSYNTDYRSMMLSFVKEKYHFPAMLTDYEEYYNLPDTDKIYNRIQDDEDRLNWYKRGLLRGTQDSLIKTPKNYHESTEEYVNPERVLTNLNKYSPHNVEVYGANDDYVTEWYSLPDTYDKEQTGDVVAWEDNARNPEYLEDTTRTDIHHEASNVSNYEFYNENTTSGITCSKQNDDGMSDGSTFSFKKSSGTRERTLLGITNELFSRGKIKSLINRFYTSEPNAPDSEIGSATRKTFGMSRGRNLLKKDYDVVNSYNNPYCRVWTSHHQYSNLKDRIRPFMDGEKFMSIKETQKRLGDGLRPNEGSSRLGDNSSLMSNGYVRISPIRNNSGEYQDDIKKCMFSIENLAWRDVHINDNLSAEQRGPNNGRIMWFPPYNLKFNENVSANWSENEFIGRGENIYTYTNTRRNGTLSFTILIDHPSVVNKWRGMGKPSDKYKDEETLLRFFAGCDNLSDDISGEKVEKKKEDKREDNQNYSPVESTFDVKYIIFFPNDFSSIDQNDGKSVIENLKKYEYTQDIVWGDKRDESYEDEKLRAKNENNINSEYLINKAITGISTELISELGLTENDDVYTFDDLINRRGMEEYYGSTDGSYVISGVDVQGFASSHGYVKNNLALCKRRASAIASIVKYVFGVDDDDITRLDGNIIAVNDVVGDKDVNRIDAKIGRCAIATVHIAQKGYMGPSNISGTTTYINNQGKDGADLNTIRRYKYDITGNMTQFKDGSYYDGEINSAVVTAEYGRQALMSKVNDSTEYQYDDEYTYFKNLEENDKLEYKNIIDKIAYFTPSFHSVTPEGFNARLTFLQQCMRQGPTQTIGESNGDVPAGNLAFGRAPYCVLRIGDFFNTKIVIDNMSIDYEGGNGISYDLNPEGIGVQPMMANVNISFSFIGGQDIAGPVDRLQNAVSYNYYANASIYDRHADYYTKYENGEKVLSQYDAMKPDIRTEITTKIQ